MTSNKQKINYVPGQHRSAVNRHAARRADDCAAFLYHRLDTLPANFNFLDIGCGPGSITLDLAERYPQATFLGIDSGDVVVAHASELAKSRAVSNATFRQGELLDPALLPGDAWGTFDVVYCHQVLNHMQQPVEGLKAMKRAAKPQAGLVAARESFRRGQLFHPTSAGIEKFLDAIFGAMYLNGSTEELGVKLVDLALQAGWKRYQIISSMSGDTFDTPEQRDNWANNVIDSMEDPNAPSRSKFEQYGITTEQEFADLAKAWRDWHAEPAAWGSCVSGEVICKNGE